MKKVTLLIIALILSLAYINAEDIYGPEESGTWTKANSPYYIYGDISVPNNETLVIEPGVEVIFKGHFYIRTLSADLIAVGTKDEMILFTIADTNGLVAGGEDEGGWNGLKFYYSSESGDTCRLEYCRFEYAKVIDYVSGKRGVISTERIPRLLVANCMFEYNYSIVNGVDCRLADVAIRNNTFINNVGDNVLLTSQSNPYFYNNRVEDNSFTIMISVYGWCFPVIERNIIKNNKVDYVIWADGDKANPTVVNNLIINNEINPGKRTVYLKDSDAKVYGNLIANNDGGGILINDGNPQIIQNTIVNNSGTYPLYVNTNEGEFNGNIIYGNTDPVYYNERTSEPSFIYNLIEGGIAGFTGDAFTGTEHGNLETPPKFVDETSGTGPSYDAEAADFGLLSTSPAINKGDPSLNEENFLSTDIYNKERVKYSYIDIGAAEGSVSKTDIGPTTYSSHETLIGDTITVSGHITIDDDVVLTIAGGSRIIFDGPYIIDVNGTLLAEGTETDSIWFTVADTNGFGGSDYDAGCWRGISVKNSGSSMDDNIPSSFEYCIFEYAKTDDGDGAVFSLSSIPDFSVSHSVFRYNRGATGNAVLSSYYSNLQFDHISVISNYSKDQYNVKGSFYLYDSDVSITNSLFKYNIGSNGVCLDVQYGTLFSSHNTFHNNSIFTWAGNGVVIEAGNAEVTIINDLAVNNTTANGPVYDFSSCFASITNSTIVNNKNTNSNFAGGIGLTRTELIITNSILYGNRAGSSHASIFMFEENTDPDLYNCLIEDGESGIRTYSGFSFTGEFVNCLDQKPHFINPTVLPGSGEDATGTNWQLLDISPAINAGAQDTSGLGLPAFDIAGNPRISNEQVDMGAFEKEGQPAMITADPQGGNFCTGDQITLLVEYSQTDTVSYQWKKDGVTIPGATSNTLEIDPAELMDEGNYVCVLNNTFGTVNTIPVFLSVKAAPQILVEPDISWVRPDLPLNLSVLVNGSSPLQYNWRKNSVNIPGAVLPEYKFIPADSSFEGAYICVISNSCGEDITTAVDLLIAPQICMVTVDPATGENLIVWEKKTNASLIGYNIYKETQASGIYDILGTVAFDDLSEFTDSAADPTVQAYLYKMTAIMMDGEETDADLCQPHKTIHLLVSTNPELNTTQLAWDKYHGFEYQTYSIYRSVTGSNFDLVHSMASSLNSWTDPLPVAGDLFYRIAVEKPSACYPEGGSKKAGTGPYQHSLSNLDDNKLKSGETTPDSILLDNNTIDENGIPGMLVGRLSTADPDSGDHHTYELVQGAGDTDNASFTVVGDMLLSATTFDYETKSSYSVRIRSTDMASNYIDTAFAISINDTEEPSGGPVTGKNPPSDMVLDNNTIDEEGLPGTLVGRMQTTDPDTIDVHSYQLVTGTGDDDNISFTVYGNLLVAATSFDYETKNSYSVRVRSTDMAANYIEKSFLIQVNDTEEPEEQPQIGASPPDSITLDSQSVDENGVAGMLVGRLNTHDPDTIDAHTYLLVQGSGDDNNSKFSIYSDLLITAGSFDYETKNTFSVRIRSADMAANYIEKVFVISINDTDESTGGTAIGDSPPDSITLDNQSIDENGQPGMIVGRLHTADPDTIDAFTYQLTAGTGDDDNSSFSVYGELLISAIGFDYETKDSYTLRIRSIDLGSNSIEKAFIIKVNDTQEPVVPIVTGASPPDTIKLDTQSISENNPIGSLVARLLTSDADTFDVHTYHLVKGTGDDDNSSFSIFGDMLLAAEVFDFEKQNSLTLRVRSTDLGRNFIEKAFVLTVLDVDETVGIYGREDQHVKVYPNPFTKSARVEFPNNEGESYRMYLMDLTGKVVMIRTDIISSKFTINRDDLSKGYYILELRGKQIYRSRIIVE